MSNTSLSQIVTGKARPREVNFSKLCQELCENPEEEKSLVDAFVRLRDSTPEAEKNKTTEINASELERAERYLERKTQAISFKRSIAEELRKAEIDFRQDYCEGIYSTDFLIEHKGKRTALECKFNVHRDFEKSISVSMILKEKLKCEDVLVVLPYENGSTMNSEKLSGIHIVTPSTMLKKIVV